MHMDSLDAPIQIRNMAPTPAHIPPEIKIKVGMNQTGLAQSGDSIGTFGLGGCTAIGVIKNDGSMFLSHYEPPGRDIQLSHVRYQLADAKHVVIYTPGEYAKSDSGKWEIQPSDHSYQSQVQREKPHVKVTAFGYIPDKEHGKTSDLPFRPTDDLQFRPTENGVTVTDGRYNIWPPLKIEL